jgi:hypothetical protein
VSEKPEIVRPKTGTIAPANYFPTTLRAAWFSTTPVQKGIVYLLSGGFVCSALMFALGQFFQIRGVQHMLTSRIFLGIAWFCASILLFGIVRATNLTRWIAIIGVVILLAAAILLDRAFPMSKTITPPLPEAKPDLVGWIVNPTSPQLLLWPTGAVARSVEADPLLWDIDRDDKTSGDSLIVNQMRYDWIRPDQHGGPSSLLDSRDIQNVVKPGHRIFGYLTLTCPECDRVRLYWIYFVYGQGGWFAEIPKGIAPNPKAIGNSIPLLRRNNALLQQELGNIPEISRIPIGEAPH